MTQHTLLSLAEIVRRTGMDRSALNRYLAEPENRALLGGADTHPQYSLSCLPRFERLASQHQLGAITPKTLAAWWRREEEMSPTLDIRDLDRNSDIAQTVRSERRNSDNGHNPETLPALTLAPASMEAGAEVLVRTVLQGVQALVADLRSQGVLVGADRLLSASEAAQMLNCKPRGVSHRVRPVGAGTYRLSDVQSYIRSLAPMCPKSERRKPKSAQMMKEGEK